LFTNKEQKTILVVDDIRLFHLTIQRALASENYHLIFKTTGQDGLDVIMRRKIHLLILDLHLPDVSGLEVLRGIKEIDRKLEGVCDSKTIAQLKDFPVIIVSAYLEKEVIEAAERMGIAGYVAKPINQTHIKAMVKNALETGRKLYSKRKLILCVDSEPRVRKLYQGALNDQRYDVITVSNGIEALETAEYHSVDLIITELNLPEMDGAEFLQTLNESNKHIPSIIVSTVSEEEIKERIENLGVKKYLSKPINLDELRKDVSEIFESDSQEDP